MTRYWNRSLQREEDEKIYGDAWVRRLYETQAGQWTSDSILSRAWLSRAYGWYQASPLSQRKIAPFVREFGIPMEEFEDPGFRSFNDFFIRKFKDGQRPFTQEPSNLAAFAEARYLAFEKPAHDQRFPVKGEFLTAGFLLGDRAKGKLFEGGPVLIARLCPTDYHRFHYPDSGRTLESFRVPGRYHSVNPLALKFKGDIFGTNERRVSILETEHFGLLAYVEVGAMCVGRICQTYPEESPFRRGDEKGYFLFGASTVIVIGQHGRWLPSPDLIKRTALHRQETWLKLGETVGGSRNQA